LDTYELHLLPAQFAATGVVEVCRSQGGHIAYIVQYRMEEGGVAGQYLQYLALTRISSAVVVKIFVPSGLTWQCLAV